MQHWPQGGAVSGPEGRSARCASATRAPGLVRRGPRASVTQGGPHNESGAASSATPLRPVTSRRSISALCPSSSPHSGLPPPLISSHRVQCLHAAHPAGHGHRCPGCAACDRLHPCGSSCRPGYRGSSCFSPSRAPSEEAPITVRFHHTGSRSAHTSRARCTSGCTIGVK